MNITTDTVYTVDEVAELIKQSLWTVIRRFENEPGVIDMGNPLTTKRARRYRVLRIPASVLHRVIARRSRGGQDAATSKQKSGSSGSPSRHNAIIKAQIGLGGRH